MYLVNCHRNFIPEEAYQLVAELLAFLYATDQKLAEKMSAMEKRIKYASPFFARSGAIGKVSHR